MFSCYSDKYSGRGVWPDWCLLDTADTSGSFNGGDVDITSISPGSTPWVSHDIVVLSSLVSISDSGDGVVEWGSTSSGVKDTTGISLEDSSISFNSNGNWSYSDGGLEGSSRSSLNSVDLGDVNCGRVWWSSACTVLGSVGIVWFESLSVLGNVVHGIWLPSSIASVACSVTVNHLLFSKGNKFSLLDLMMSFNSAGGWESPAWTALSLVLNWVDSSLCSPVDWGWDVDGIEDSWFNFGNVSWGSESEHFLVFSISPGRHEVVSNGEGVLWVGVDLIVLSILGHEDSLSEVIFLGGSIWESVFGNVFHELGVVKWVVFELVAHVLKVEVSGGNLAGGEHLVKLFSKKN